MYLLNKHIVGCRGEYFGQLLFESEDYAFYGRSFSKKLMNLTEFMPYQ